MEHKFKVGDIISNSNFTSNEFEIIAIVEGTDTFEGTWTDSLIVTRKCIKDSYLLKIIKSTWGVVGRIGSLYFSDEAFYECCCESYSLKTNTLNSSCPRCKSLTIKKLSQDPYTGQMFNVDKCQTCGWC